MNKKRKTGNGTSNRQWLYVIANPSVALLFSPIIYMLPVAPWIQLSIFGLLLLTKVGITGYLELRFMKISKTSPGIDVLIYAVPISYAYQLEQWIHRKFKWLNCPWFGSGHSEWFFSPVGIVAILLSFPVFIFQFAWILIKWSSIVIVFYIILKSILK